VRYCTLCGAALGEGWKYCAACAAPVIADEAPSVVAGATEDGPILAYAAARDSEGRVEAGLTSTIEWVLCGSLMLCAAVLTVVGLFPDYYKGGHSLASNPASVWLNVPGILGWGLAGVLLLVPRTRTLGAAFSLGVTALFAPLYVSDIGALWTESESAGLGVILGLIGLAVALVGAGLGVFLLIRSHAIGLSRAVSAWAWAAGAGVVGITYSVATAFAWFNIHLHATVPGFRYTLTGTPNVTVQFGSLVKEHGWTLAGDLLLIVLVPLVLLIAAYSAPPRISAAMFIGAALAMLAGPIAATATLATPVTAAALHLSPQDVSASGVVITQHGLPGLWIAIIAATAVGFAGVARAISAFTSADTVPDAPVRSAAPAL
jgi:hypothetical protein